MPVWNKEDLICTIGGGTGMPIVNRALVKAGYKNISSIVTTFDSGGDTGRMRTDEKGKILAFSDYWRSLMSLWEDGEQKTIWEEVLRFRDDRGRNFGNMFFQFMSEITNNLSEVDALFEKLTKIKLKGRVIPVTLEPAELCFRTESGKSYCGEHNLDELRMSYDKIEKIWLSREVKANPEVIREIEKSKIIILSPGSMYGSVITNFLPVGVKTSLEKSKAIKILITNIMSVANENRFFSQEEYCRTIRKYVKIDFDLILMADLKKLKTAKLRQVLDSYKLEHSLPIKYKTKGKTQVMVENLATIDEINLRIRHSEEKLVNFFARMEACPKRK
jgi:uncharacterized cofD-like protein